MLPSEYLMYKYKGEEIQPKRLPLDKANLELSAQIIAVFQNAFESRVARWVLDEVLSALEGDDTGYRVRRGLAHILSSNYSTFDIVSPLEPATRKGVQHGGVRNSFSRIQEGQARECSQRTQCRAREGGFY